MFYNTTHEAGQILIDFEAKALSLEDRVLHIFQSNPVPMNWSEAHALLPEANEVSFKRSITNLKNRFLLEKTNELAVTCYGVNAHRYKYVGL